MATEQYGEDVELLRLETQPVASIRGTIPVAELGEHMGGRLGELGAYLRQHGVQPAGPPFVRYHAFGETETDFELGVPLAAPVEGEGRITGNELPGGAAAATWHLGAHDRLGDAYARLEAWLNEHSRERSSPGWEVYYWIDLGDEGGAPPPDPASWRTRLIQPIKESPPS